MCFIYLLTLHIWIWNFISLSRIVYFTDPELSETKSQALYWNTTVLPILEKIEDFTNTGWNNLQFYKVATGQAKSG